MHVSYSDTQGGDRAYPSASKLARREASVANAPSGIPFGHRRRTSPRIRLSFAMHTLGFNCLTGLHTCTKSHMRFVYPVLGGNQTLSGVGPDPISRSESNVIAKKG